MALTILEYRVILGLELSISFYVTNIFSNPRNVALCYAGKKFWRLFKFYAESMGNLCGQSDKADEGVKASKCL